MRALALVALLVSGCSTGPRPYTRLHGPWETDPSLYYLTHEHRIVPFEGSVALKGGSGGGHGGGGHDAGWHRGGREHERMAY